VGLVDAQLLQAPEHDGGERARSLLAGGGAQAAEQRLVLLGGLMKHASINGGRQPTGWISRAFCAHNTVDIDRSVMLYLTLPPWPYPPDPTPLALRRILRESRVPCSRWTM